MLTEKQVSEIREHLERAQNPLFFFDNDQDGLCSFLLLQRAFERGKGIPIKSFPELTATYFRRVGELNADYIFVLDKPLISEEFVEEARRVNIPIVWIDHHDVASKITEKIPEGIFYYNPVYNKKKTSEPVSALCYQITNRKEDLWIAFTGCIADAYVPDFYNDFKRQYPELLPDESNKSEDVLEVYFSSELGKIAQILGAGLKDTTTNVVAMLKFLIKSKGPYDILEETGKNFFMHKRFETINKRYKKLVEKASANVDSNPSEKILFFEYGGDLSISSELANGLKHKFPDKTIVVSYIAGAKINISIRGENVREVILKVVKKIDGATGGGHPDAVGAKINSGDLELFKERFKEEILRKNYD